MQGLGASILVKTREVGKQVIESPNSRDECDSLIKTLARAFYDKLFNWLVKKLN
jgi:myosin heavy subunit